MPILKKYEGAAYILQADYVELLDFQAKFAAIKNSLMVLLLQKKDYSKTQGYTILKGISDYIPVFLQAHIVESPIEFEDRIEALQTIPADPPHKWKLEKIKYVNGYRTYKIENSNGAFTILEQLIDAGDDIVIEYYFINSLGKWQKFHAAEPRKMIDDFKVIGQTALETGGIVLAGTVVVAVDVFTTRGAMFRGFLARFITHVAVQRFFLAIQGLKDEKLDT